MIFSFATYTNSIDYWQKHLRLSVGLEESTKRRDCTCSLLKEHDTMSYLTAQEQCSAGCCSKRGVVSNPLASKHLAKRFTLKCTGGCIHLSHSQLNHGCVQSQK